MKANWITLAVGYELCGESEKALTVFEQLSGAMKVSRLHLSGLPT